MSSPEEWYKGLPPITKIYFTSAVATTILVSLGALDPYSLYLDFDKIFYKFEIWRLLTCFVFFGKFSMPFVFSVVILVRYFNHLETGYYMGNKGTAEMTFLCLFGAVCLWVLAYFLGTLPFIGSPLVFMVLYLWSRKDPHTRISFWGFSLQAWHFPFVLMMMGVILGNSPVPDAIGILVGHSYHFMHDITYKAYGKQFLWTPEWIYNLFLPSAGSQRPTQGWQRGGHRLDQ